MLSPGMMIKGRYEILEEIGSGGMAHVFRILDHSLNKQAAMKVLKDELQKDRMYLKRFLREAQAVAAISHPNIVNVYDVDRDKGHWFIVMELAEGITLKQYIRKKGRLPVNECVSIALQAADALYTVHKGGVIHRDIKPDNLILTLEGNLKISDFGIARVSSAETVTIDACGSVYYSSPEQVRGSYCDQRTDIYSLGVTLYEMVTGRLPYNGSTVVEVAMQHMEGRVASPRELIPEIPADVDYVIMRCMNRRMDDRYFSMKEVKGDLRKCITDPGALGHTDEGVQGETVIFSKEEMETIQAAPKKPVRTRKEPSPEKKAKKSKKPKKSPKKEVKRDIYDQEIPEEEELAGGLRRAINIGLVLLILIVGMCILEFVLSSFGMLRGVTRYLPSLDKLLNSFNSFGKGIGQNTDAAGWQDTLHKLMSLLPFGR